MMRQRGLRPNPPLALRVLLLALGLQFGTTVALAAQVTGTPTNGTPVAITNATGTGSYQPFSGTPPASSFASFISQFKPTDSNLFSSAATGVADVGNLLAPVKFTFQDTFAGQATSTTGSFTDEYVFTLNPASFTGHASGSSGGEEDFSFEKRSSGDNYSNLTSIWVVDLTAQKVIANGYSGQAGWVYNVQGKTTALNDTYALIVAGTATTSKALTASAVYSGSFMANAIPEPSQLHLLIAGLVLLGMSTVVLRRRGS